MSACKLFFVALLNLPGCVVIIQNEKGEPVDTDLPDTDPSDGETDASPADSDLLDADDDGVPADQDCDDDDPTLGAIATDGDCDGTPIAEDCDDGDPGVGAMSVDPDCNGAPGCQAMVERVHPGDGATQIFYRRSGLRVEFGQDERSTATISVRSVGGALAPGVTAFSADGRTMTYLFSAPLAPVTTYVADISYSCGFTLQSTFTTSATGTPVDGADRVGSVYELDLVNVDPLDVSEPFDWDLIAATLAAQPPLHIYLSPAAIGPDGFTTRLGTGIEGARPPEQDLCQPAADLPFLSSYDEDPHFTGSATNLQLLVGVDTWQLRSLETSGAFTPDGGAIEGLRVDALIDMAESTYFGVGDLCSILAITGVACGDCGDGTTTCARFQVEGLRAVRVDAAPLQTVDAADIAANPTCEL